MTIQQSVTERGEANPRMPSGKSGWTAVVAALAAVLCCVAPLLVAGGIIGALEGSLPVVAMTVTAAALLLAGSIYWIRHLRSTRNDRG